MKKLMQTIPQQEAEDLARSLPWEKSTSWGGAVFMVVAMPLARAKLYLDIASGSRNSQTTSHFFRSRSQTGLINPCGKLLTPIILPKAPYKRKYEGNFKVGSVLTISRTD